MPLVRDPKLIEEVIGPLERGLIIHPIVRRPKGERGEDKEKPRSRHQEVPGGEDKDGSGDG